MSEALRRETEWSRPEMGHSPLLALLWREFLTLPWPCVRGLRNLAFLSAQWAEESGSGPKPRMATGREIAIPIRYTAEGRSL